MVYLYGPSQEFSEKRIKKQPALILQLSFVCTENDPRGVENAWVDGIYLSVFTTCRALFSQAITVFEGDEYNGSRVFEIP